MGDLGCAVKVGGVGIQIDNAVAVLVEGEHTAAQRSAGLGADTAQVTLDKAEGVVVVVIQGSITIVVQRSNGHLQLIDHGGGQLAGGQGHAVVTGLNDTGNIGHVVANGDTSGGVVVNFLGDQVRQGRASSLGFHSGEVPVVLGADSQEEILSGSAIGQVEAPAGSSGGNIGSAAVLGHVVNDFLGKLHAAVVDSVPESLLLVSSEVSIVGVILASLGNQLGQGGHGVAVLLQTNEGGGVDGSGTVIGRVQVDIQGEDDIINGHRGAVRERDVVAHGDGVVHGAVVILGDNTVSGSAVGVIGAVVLAGFALDAVQNHFALTVSTQQGAEGQVDNVLVGSGSGEEGVELTLKAGVGQNERTVAGGSGSLGRGSAGSFAGCSGGSGAAAAGQHAQAQGRSRCQRNGLLCVFHVYKTS